MRKNIDSDGIEFLKLITTRMKEIRIEQKRTLVDVAVVAEINPSYYARIERGKAGDLRFSTLNKIKDGLEVSWGEFLGKDHIYAQWFEGETDGS